MSISSRDNGEGPIIVDAPARFAIIAPGLPSPHVIIASSEQVSDLVGFYSLREAGLENVVLSKSSEPRNRIYETLLYGNSPNSEPYLAFDLWRQDEESGRELLYSLIIHNPGAANFTSKYMDTFRGNIDSQVERVVSAYNDGRRDELIYVGQMLATFVGLLLDRMSYEENKIKQRSLSIKSIITLYAGVLAMLATVLAVVAVAKDSAGQSLLNILLQR